MSASRPAHLGRRGAMYLVRFRIPVSLSSQVGMVELSRSLCTSDAREARRRCLLATAWFRSTIEKLDAMTSPSRADLEDAARVFFEEMAADVDRPRSFDHDHFDDDVVFSIEASRERTRSLDDQLRANQFDGMVQHRGGELARRTGAAFDQLTAQDRLLVLQLAARVEREQMEVLIHGLTKPANRREPVDDLFAIVLMRAAPPPGSLAQRVPAPCSMILRQAVEIYLARKQAKGLSQSQLMRLAALWDG